MTTSLVNEIKIALRYPIGFRKYLENFKDEDIVGVGLNAATCPLSKFIMAHHLTIERAEVCSLQIRLTIEEKKEDIFIYPRVPTWISRYVLEIDSVSRGLYPNLELTKGVTLEALEKVSKKRKE